jgi:hypothetical protein
LLAESLSIIESPHAFPEEGYSAYGSLAVSRAHHTGLVTPVGNRRKASLIVRMNRILRTLLLGLCGVAVLGYGLNVAASNEVGKLQEQAGRLNEQNTELSAQLLKVISFQGIQDNELGRFGLRVPEHVVIVKDLKPPLPAPFRPDKQPLPLMSGY